MGRGRSGVGPRTVGTTRSQYSSRGEVPLVANDRIGGAGEYQGTNSGSGRADSKFLISDGRMEREIDRMRKESPKTFSGNGIDEVLRQISSVNGPESAVTVYRATLGDSINHGDWVFLSEAQADRFARASMSRRPKKGYKVVKAKVRAKQVGWTGKNLEFVMM